MSILVSRWDYGVAMRHQTRLRKFGAPYKDSLEGFRYERKRAPQSAPQGILSPTEGGPAMATNVLSPSERENQIAFEEEDRFPQRRFDPARGIWYGVLWGALLWLVLVMPFFL